MKNYKSLEIFFMKKKKNKYLSLINHRKKIKIIKNFKILDQLFCLSIYAKYLTFASFNLSSAYISSGKRRENYLE